MPQLIDVPGMGSVEFPDGMNDQQIVAAIQRNMQAPPKPQSSPQYATKPEFSLFGNQVTTPPNESGFNLPAAVISAGSWMDRMNNGIQQAQFAPGDALRGLLGMGQSGASAAIDQAQAEGKKPMEQLTAVHPGSALIGEVGAQAGMPMRMLPAIAGSEYGSIPERVGRGSMALLGSALTQKLGGVAANQAGASATTAAENAAKNAASQPFRDAGLAVPPEQANPTLFNRVLGGFSGGAKNEQAASRINESRFVDLARNSLGLSPSEAVTPGALAKIRADAYATSYKPVEDIPRITSDSAFDKAIASISPKGSGGAVPSPAQGKIDELVSNLMERANFGSWTGAQMVRDIRSLREQSSANFSSAARAGGDIEKTDLARAQSAAANQLEELAGRNGAPIQQLREARTKIAITHSVEDALAGDNKISPRELFKQYDKGTPLTGGLKTMAEFYQQYPGSSQVINSATKSNPFSVMDALISAGPAMAVGAAHGALPGVAVAAGGVAARPLLRSAIMSPQYQRNMTLLDEQVRGLLGKRVLESPLAPWAGGLLGYQASP